MRELGHHEAIPGRQVLDLFPAVSACRLEGSWAGTYFEFEVVMLSVFGEVLSTHERTPSFNLACCARQNAVMSRSRSRMTWSLT